MALPWADFGWTIFFTLAGLTLTFVGLLVLDWITPYRFLEEIERGNKAVAWMIFGFLVSSGLILKSAFQQDPGLVESLAYAVVGMLLNYLGYYIWEWITPRWSLNQAIKNGSVPAGIVVAGIFIAIGLTVSGAFGGGIFRVIMNL
jgi:putative membrane protein